jgi:hypothetical protein
VRASHHFCPNLSLVLHATDFMITDALLVDVHGQQCCQPTIENNKSPTNFSLLFNDNILAWLL